MSSEEPEAVLPPDVDLDEVSRKVAQASYERTRVNVLLRHGKALLDWEEQNPAMRRQLLEVCAASVKDTVNTLREMGVDFVGHQSGAAVGDDPGPIGETPPPATLPGSPPEPPFPVGGPSYPLETKSSPVVPLVMAAWLTTSMARRYLALATMPWAPWKPAGRLVTESVRDSLARTVYR